MFTKHKWEQLLAMYEQHGSFSEDISKAKFIICGQDDLIIFRRFGSTWKSKRIEQWRYRTYTQANLALQVQRYKDEG